MAKNVSKTNSSNSASFKSAIAEAKKLWSAAKVKANEMGGGDFESLEDGRYKAVITEASLGESKSSGRLQAKIVYTVLEGENKGRKVYSYQGLDNEDRLMYFALFLNKFGFELPEDFADVEEVLQEIVKEKVALRIILKTKGDFQNTKIQKVLGESDLEEEAKEENEEEEVEEVEEVEEEVEEDEEVEEKKIDKKSTKKVASKIVEGSKVSFKDGKTTVVGTVTDIADDVCTVEDENEDGYEIDISDLTLVEESDSDESSKKKSKKVSKVEDDEEESEEEEVEEVEEEVEEVEEEVEEVEEDEEVELDVGMTVTWTSKGEEKSGTVLQILEKEGKVVVQTGKGKNMQKIKIAADKIESVSK